MTDTKIQVGDIGTELLLTITEGDGSGNVVDVSSATTLQIIIKAGSAGAIPITKTASFKTDGTDGKIRVLTVSGDISEAGAWTMQGYIVLPGGSWHTSVGHFAVVANL